MKKMILKSTGESVHLVEDFKDYSDLIMQLGELPAPPAP